MGGGHVLILDSSSVTSFCVLAHKDVLCHVIHEPSSLYFDHKNIEVTNTVTVIKFTRETI